MQSGWRIGSLFKIPLYVDSSWFLILVLVTFLYGSDPDWQSTMGAVTAWGAGFLLALLLFASVLLHELGHSLVARSQGIQVNSITLFLFGGIASIDKESKTPGQAFQVAIAGPLVSLSLFVLFSLLSGVLQSAEITTAISYNMAQTNLVLALFNLIPGLPLDGGQILKAAIWKATGSRNQGIRWAATVGKFLGWGAIGLGLLSYLNTQRFDLLWIALIGWFIVRNAQAYSRVNDLQEALADLQAADAMMRDYRVVDANLTLRQFADDYLLQEGRPPMYFAASDGRYRGWVVVEDLRTVERSQWEQQTLMAIVRSLGEIPTVREATPLPQVINQLEEQQLSRITVLSPADAVAGVIDRGDIVRAIAAKMNISISDAVIQQIKEEGVYPPGLQLQAIAQTATES
ncbi:MAG: site-2 protease family protein [Leptolyngbyaceae cyanobacterium SM1_1_3]|nr:site-2 protease family protein [Leptolyngbyaceae cyanobacterium SM1_1_3]NJN04719.1 site-2 protease family protein [Leptolyngbyaceae cyanobacterium RM1_1_2]NJO11169.1 site-2 protease family protein [Leptolyngbyaceae cyanobacterium SL_1_1]